MTLERDKRILILALQVVGRLQDHFLKPHTPHGGGRGDTISKSKTLERKKISVKKAKLDSEELKKTAQDNLFKSQRAHARDLKVLHHTAQAAMVG
uniref:Uncharacterized protein n=1 Tax=Lepeophtheirus salmonis TaxID=72036 RepID=A0A0K2VIF3_LEPSM